MARNANWTPDELLAALELYCRTPFGKQHSGNPEVIRLARLIGRTAGAVAYKLNNLTRSDPAELARGVHGASHGSKADEELFRRFLKEPDAVTIEMTAALARLGAHLPRPEEEAKGIPVGPSETMTVATVRLLQSHFRRRVLDLYSHSCAMCDIDIPALLTACHIIPWAQAANRRTDPRNGLALCALHDRAFDRGMLTVDEAYRVHVVPARLGNVRSNVVRHLIVDLEGAPLSVPRRFPPDPVALASHREWAVGPADSCATEAALAVPT